MEECPDCFGVGLAQAGPVQRLCRPCKGKGFIQVNVPDPEAAAPSEPIEEEMVEQEKSFFKRLID